VQITEEIDWTELEELVQAIRLSKLKNAAGRPPHLRALIGALVLRAMRYRPLRELEDLIRYYAPARLLCGLRISETNRCFGSRPGSERGSEAKVRRDSGAIT
jgi:hypothetical protein